MGEQIHISPLRLTVTCLRFYVHRAGRTQPKDIKEWNETIELKAQAELKAQLTKVEKNKDVEAKDVLGKGIQFSQCRRQLRGV